MITEKMMEILDSLKESGKRKKEIFETNKKRYWKLPASERLHYDYRSEQINKDNEIIWFSLTFEMFKIFFFIFASLFILKFLFELDTSLIIRLISVFIPIIPLVLKVSITIDIVMIFLSSYNRKKNIKKLMKNYGFEL